MLKVLFSKYNCFKLNKIIKKPYNSSTSSKLWDEQIKGLSICSVNLKKKPITSYLSRKELVNFK